MKEDPEEKVEESLYVISISKDEFDLIPPDQRAALALVSFAKNEVSALEKGYILSLHPSSGYEDIDAGIYIQQHMFLRNWSATILDFSKLFTEKAKTKNKTEDVLLLDLFESARNSFSELKSAASYDVSNILRSEVTNHYYLEPARRNLDYVGANANLNVYFHKMDGNSFSALGEEVMFLGRINQHAHSKNEKRDALLMMREWAQWNMDASQLTCPPKLPSL